MSIIFYKRNHCGVCTTPYSPQYVATHPSFYFVFGDNLDRIGSAGQAIIRDCTNSIGLATKRHPDTHPSSYMMGTKSDYLAVQQDFDLIKQLITNGQTVIFPSKGLGTGLARLQTTAPDLLNYIDTEVSHLIGTDYKLLR